MLKRFQIPLFLVCAVGSIGSIAESKPARQTAPAPRTVRDYYLLLPRGYFAESPRENLRLRPMVNDPKNDYLQTRASDTQALITTKLFRYRGAELFAFQHSPVLPVTAPNVLKFYRLRGGKLQDVTAQFWPVKLGVNEFVYLPRRGTTIVVRDENDPGEPPVTLFKMVWRGGRFVKVR